MHGTGERMEAARPHSRMSWLRWRFTHLDLIDWLTLAFVVVGITLWVLADYLTP